MNKNAATNLGRYEVCLVAVPPLQKTCNRGMYRLYYEWSITEGSRQVKQSHRVIHCLSNDFMQYTLQSSAG